MPVEIVYVKSTYLGRLYRKFDEDLEEIARDLYEDMTTVRHVVRVDMCLEGVLVHPKMNVAAHTPVAIVLCCRVTS